MKFRQKLSRLSHAGPGSESRPPVGEPASDLERAERRRARVSRLRNMLGHVSLDTKRARARAAAVTNSISDARPFLGEAVETDFGVLHRVETRWESGYRVGTQSLRSVRQLSAAQLADLALEPSLAEVNCERLLFLDTETTGLSGGTGTIPFLIGLAWFEGDVFRLEQLLVPRPGEESPALHRLRERMAWASALVTYNGKSYDWPLLRTRHVMNRVPASLPTHHVDLLHVSRRIFSRRLSRVRLVDLEAEVLGMHREDDVDGSEIPDIYWEVVRGGDPSRLEGVLDHNQQDLLSLAAMLGWMCEAYEEPEVPRDVEDQLGLARVSLRAERPHKARAFTNAVIAHSDAQPPRRDALWMQAEMARKAKEPEARISLLEQALECSREADWQARIHLALAKCFEHDLKRIDKALGHARRTALAEGEAAMERRVVRLERRLVKQG